MFAGLPELGISNGEDLKETLTNCTEPLKAIDQFQVRFCLSNIHSLQMYCIRHKALRSHAAVIFIDSNGRDYNLSYDKPL